MVNVGMNGQELDGHNTTVNKAQTHAGRGGGGGGGFGGGGGEDGGECGSESRHR